MNRKNTVTSIQKMFFRTQIVLIVTLALFLGIAGTLVSLRAETRKRDLNLLNIAEAIAHSPIIAEENADTLGSAELIEYLDSLKAALGDIDVISVVKHDRTRLYHSNHTLIGTAYDGNMPQPDPSARSYVTSETGPSGHQRRAYAGIYDAEGNYVGFVMAIMLKENINSEILQTTLIFAAVTVAAIVTELLVCAEMSRRIKRSLLGYEPDVFTSMFKTRDNILEALDEGIVAVDSDSNVQYANRAACEMLGCHEDPSGQKLADLAGGILSHSTISDTLSDTQKHAGAHIKNADSKTDILLDSIPVVSGDKSVGAVGILRDRAEYTRLMEDLAGTRYLVDSMRANNHDFTNKLHVILGLIEMGLYDKATAYIQNITVLERSAISRIMNAISEPSVAALLIGKAARASELDVRFTLREGCHYSPSDLQLPPGVLVTVIGNLLDNAFDAMNDRQDYDAPRELLFGIFSKPGAVLITVDDTGGGISPENTERIFENGYSTKGEGRGTGLYRVKQMVEQSGGSISVESQPGVGTCFTVSFTGKEVRKDV